MHQRILHQIRGRANLTGIRGIEERTSRALDRHSDRQTDRWTARQSDSQTDRHTDILTQEIGR
jgi:hypothetical protein